MLNLAGLRLPPREEKKMLRRTQSSKRNLRECEQLKQTCRSRTSVGNSDAQHLPFHKADQLRYNLTDEEKRKHRLYATKTQSSMVSSFGLLAQKPIEKRQSPDSSGYF